MTTTEKIDFDAELLAMQKQGEASLKIMMQHGFVLDTSEWLTIARYARKYDISTNVVSNWIARGVIPADCVEELPVLNNMKMVKDQPYR